VAAGVFWRPVRGWFALGVALTDVVATDVLLDWLCHQRWAFIVNDLAVITRHPFARNTDRGRLVRLTAD
jgi:hypothetical protein